MMNENGVFNTIFIEKISQKDKLDKTESDAKKTELAPTLASWRQAPALAPGARPGSRRQGLGLGAKPDTNAFSKIR